MHVMATGRAGRQHGDWPHAPIGVPTPIMSTAAPAPSRQPIGRRRLRELATIRAMVRMYCADHHGQNPELCAECAPLLGYAARRLERCVFGDAKPTCANCTVHCYSAAKREQVRIVMRYAGPRMLLRHPVLGIAHLADGKRPAPELPAKASAS